MISDLHHQHIFSIGGIRSLLSRVAGHEAKTKNARFSLCSVSGGIENNTPSFNILIYIVAISLTAAIFSVIAQGFRFGINNNVYHIPYVLGLYKSPIFSVDQFYQSLRKFTSCVWPLVSIFSTPQNVGSVFMVFHILSRWFTLMSIIYTTWYFGLQNKWKILGISAIFAASPIFYGVSLVGKSGLFLNYFTHTEMTYSFLLFSMLLMIKGHLKSSFLVNGLTFNINAFVGFWGGFTLAISWLIQKPLGVSGNWITRTRGLALAVGINILVGSPTILWIVWTMLGEPTGQSFDYRSYLRLFYPYHFFINASSSADIFELILCFLSGFISLFFLRNLAHDTRRAWYILYSALAFLFLLGAVMPELTGNRMLLNLHLLRVDGVIEMLALLFVGTAALTLLYGFESSNDRTVGAMAIMCALAIGRWHVIAPAVIMTLLVTSGEKTQTRQISVLLFIIVAGISLLIVPQHPTWGASRVTPILASILFLITAITNRSRQWAALSIVLVSDAAGYASFDAFAAGICLLITILWQKERIQWISYLMAVESIAIFLLAISHDSRGLTIMVIGIQVSLYLVVVFAKMNTTFSNKFKSLATSVTLISLLVFSLGVVRVTNNRPGPLMKAWDEARSWVRDTTPDNALFLIPLEPEGFQLHSNRRVWVDQKQGAAVMWSPSFFQQWHIRFVEVSQLKTFEDWRLYTCRNRIDYLVFAWPPGKSVYTYQGAIPRAVFSNEACSVFPRRLICGGN